MTKRIIYYLCAGLGLGLLILVSLKTAPKPKDVPEIAPQPAAEAQTENSEQPEPLATTATAETKDIFGTIESESLWAIDVEDPQALINDVRPGVPVSTTKIKIISIGDAVFYEGPEGSRYSSQTPVTPVEVETLEFINGSAFPEHFTLYVDGGEIPIAEYMKVIDTEEIEKLGINALTRSEQESKYISFTSESSYQFEIGKEYVCIIKFSENANMYALPAEGYSVFVEESAAEKTGKSTPEYKNVLTQKDLGL